MSMKLEFIIAAIDRATKPVSDVSKGIDRLLKPAREVRASLNALMGAARFDQLRSSVARVGSAFDGVMASARGVAALVGGVGFAAAGAFYAFKRVADGVDGINDLAVKLSISTQRLQEMGYAAQMAGSNQEELGQGLMFLNKNIAEARAGSAELRQAFANAGISAKDLQNGSFTAADAYERMGDVFMRASETGKDGAAMTSVAMTLMGRAGAQQIQALSQGSAKMREMYAEARRLGVVLSAETVKGMTDFNDQFDKSKLVLFGALATALSVIAPRIRKVGEGFTDLISSNRELISANIAEMFERLEKAMPRIVASSAELATGMGILFSLADSLAEAMGGWDKVMYVLAAGVVVKLAAGVWTLGAAVWGLNLGLLGTLIAAAPLIAAVVAIGAALGVVGLVVYREWGNISAVFNELGGYVKSLLGWLNELTGLSGGLKKLEDLMPNWMKLPEVGPGGALVPAGQSAVQRASAIAPRAGQGKIEAGGSLNITIDDQRARVTKAEKAPGGVVDLNVYNGGSFLSLGGS